MNRSCVAAVIGVLAAAGAAKAQLFTSDPYLYGQGRTYQQSGAPAHFQAGGSFFDIFIELDMLGPPIGAPPPGVFHNDPVPSGAALGISLNGLPPGVPWEVPPGILNIGSSGNDGVNFQTEMLAMHLVKVSDPGPPARSFYLRESPSLASLGQTHITPDGGGMFRIDSFFDVFTELSLDDGQTWLPATNGSVRLNLIPAPGAPALLGLGGLLMTRRRRA